MFLISHIFCSCHIHIALLPHLLASHTCQTCHICHPLTPGAPAAPAAPPVTPPSSTLPSSTLPFFQISPPSPRFFIEAP
ncbi:hypothetical protein B0T26DRAFT_719470 [Lasiosphaeria miniovina]|uniref:Secreted protein n=1 Tax=Lasiosphaeria miniovina TaxID=1954250 RepID=A0AA40AE14_9PEZI|nr:uncharacterized protein B0T26DRAFT_719470 [Lasiosphaeria miniovina]KAK0714077.1 hypothetical protein B0T26DRAFT_719470 [Lasiosphaeria miniovina]